MRKREKGSAVLDSRQMEARIFTLRGQKVMLDEDLATLYNVPTKRLNEQVKRNALRFPEDFTFRITPEELQEVIRMRSQIATAYRRNVRFPPLAFTEHGALMAASVLDSPAAVEMSIAVVRTFIKMRTVLSQTSELARKLDELDRKYSRHDAELKVVFNTLREMMKEPREEAKPPPRRRIGFET